VEKINVSHRVQRRVSGALHEETIYGKTKKPGEFVVRKPLESLTPAMVEEIRDPAIRKLVMDRLSQFNVAVGRKAKGGIPKEVWKDPLLMPSGVPVKKVRVIKRDETIRELRDGDPAYVKPGSTHHVCIFEYVEKGKAKREAVFVTMLEAMERVKRRQPIVQKSHPKRRDAKFLMSISAGETVIADRDGKNRLLVFRTSAATEQKFTFTEHSDARRSADAKKINVSANVLTARKVTVDPLGRIRWAHD